MIKYKAKLRDGSIIFFEAFASDEQIIRESHYEIESLEVVQ